MPLAGYGVLIGTLVSFTREDPNDFGSWYHGKMTIDAPQGQYECAIDVSTPSGVPVQYREVRNVDATLFTTVSNLGPGWHPLASNATSGAIDYLRSHCSAAGDSWRNDSPSVRAGSTGSSPSSAARTVRYSRTAATSCTRRMCPPPSVQ